MAEAISYQVTVIGETVEHVFQCPGADDVLSAMKRARLAVVPVGCRGGGCGVCRVEVVSGGFEAGKMSTAHVSCEELSSKTAALACKMYPVGDVAIRPTGRLFKKIDEKIREIKQSSEIYQPK